jgi:hypothetical protein
VYTEGARRAPKGLNVDARVARSVNDRFRDGDKELPAGPAALVSFWKSLQKRLIL